MELETTVNKLAGIVARAIVLLVLEVIVLKFILRLF